MQLAAVRADPASVTDAEWVALLGADGDELLELCAVADAARREVTDPDVMTRVRTASAMPEGERPTARVMAPASTPHRLPTPPNTTTRKLSMM